MTVDKEIVKISYGDIGQYGGQLIFPSDWVRADLAKEMIALPSEADLFTETVGQHYPIGTQLRKNGKLYRYSKAGAAMAAGVKGFLKFFNLRCPGLAGNSVAAGYEAAMAAAVVAGQTYFDISDTAAAKNEYENAYAVWYDDTTNIYDDAIVIGNDKSDGTTTRCYIAPPGFKGAHAAAVQVTVYRNPYISITGATNTFKSAAGWAKFAITSAYYFWLQTAGIISGVTGASTWPGQTAYQRDVYCNTDGSLIGITSTTYLYQRVGFLYAGTSATYGDNLIHLELDR